MFSSPLVHNSMIMAVLLILAIGLIWLIIRKIAGKGIISKLSGMTLLAVAIDCELAFILGQINLSIFNVLSIFTPGIIITLVIIYMMHKIVVVPVQNLIEIGKKLAIGDINNEVPYVSNDEIGDLAKVVRSVITYQKSISSSAKKIISGDISIIKPLSEKDELSNSFNVLVTTLANLIAEIKLLTKHAIEGELNTRGNITKFEGGFREIINGINYTLDAVITPVNEGSIVLEAMSKGDLTVSVKGIYKGDHQKLKTSINQLAESMNRALNEVNDAVEATASSANEISASSDQMAKSSSEQSQQTNEIVASIAQMTKTIVENSHNISKASENSLSASDSAKEGKEKVDATKKGIFEIVSSTKTTGSKISLLAARTDQIGEITQVINDIADQTNLLALNAAIEAARAGEQGRGFSVVADEVRKLAERTSKATKEIADTIKLIQAEAFDVQRSMEVATLAVEKGVNLTEEVASSLNHILLKNNEVSDIVVQIASSGEEQAAGAEEISKSIGVISNVSHQSLDGITQIAKAADDLNNLTINLQRLVSRFRLNRSNKNDYLVP